MEHMFYTTVHVLAYGSLMPQEKHMHGILSSVWIPNNYLSYTKFILKFADGLHCQKQIGFFV